MTTLQGTDFRHYRLVLALLTTALAIAIALAVFFAVTRTSAVAGDGNIGPSSQSTEEQQDAGIPVDAPCWRVNVPC